MEFNLFSPHPSDRTSATFSLIILGFSLVVLSIIAVVSYRNKYTLPKKFAAVLVICYSLVVPGGIMFYFLTKN